MCAMWTRNMGMWGQGIYLHMHESPLSEGQNWRMGTKALQHSEPLHKDEDHGPPRSHPTPQEYGRHQKRAIKKTLWKWTEITD